MFSTERLTQDALNHVTISRIKLDKFDRKPRLNEDKVALTSATEAWHLISFFSW